MTDAPSTPPAPPQARLSALAAPVSARLSAAAARLWSAMRAEPLLQFAAIGLALFALDRMTAPATVDPRRIVVGPAVQGELVDIYAETHGRAPTVDEMAPLIDRWIMNETVYREARALGLDDGDDMIKERIMQKMRVLMHNAIVVDAPDEATARAFFEANRDRYDDPATLSLELARLDGDEAAARALADRLNAAAPGQAVPDAPRILALTDRPRPALASVLGEALVADIEAAPEGRWRAVESGDGWQAMRLVAQTPGRRATFEEARNVAAADWREREARIRARESVEALMADYPVEVAPYDPAAFADRAAAAATRQSP